MRTSSLKRPNHLWIEFGFVAAIIAAFVYVGWFFRENGYLPQPFFYEPWGVLMDWYSLTGFAHNGGEYDVGGSIYPPLSFVVLKALSFKSCYVNNGYEQARDCDWLGVVALTAILIVNVALTFASFRRLDRRTYLPRAFALSLGLPMIFTYERGNLLLFCYASVVLGYGPLLRSARLRWLFAGIAANFKVYLIGALLAPLLHRRWLQTECLVLAAAVVYLVTFMILGDGAPWQVISNVTQYAAGFGSTHLNDLWYPSSLIPAITLLGGQSFPVTTYLNSDVADRLLLLANVLMRATQVLVVLAAVATWLRPEAVPRHRGVFLAIAMAVSTSEVGGYTQILLLFFVFMERWQGFARALALIVAYALCVPVEYVQSKLLPLVRVSWLNGGTAVYTEYGVGLLALVRPLLSMLIVWCLVGVTLREVWTDIQRQRWKTRWRFRGDASIMVGEGRARAPLLARSE